MSRKGILLFIELFCIIFHYNNSFRLIKKLINVEEKDNKKLIYQSLFSALIIGMGIVGYFVTKDKGISLENKPELDSLYHQKLDSLEKNYLFEKDSLDRWYFRNR